MRRLLVIALVATVSLPAVAAAQMVQRPQRPYRGLFGGGPQPDPNRSRQELTLTASVLGGWDDWISPLGGGGQVQPGLAQRSGNSGVGEATIQYWLGQTGRSFSVNGRATTSVYEGINVGPTTAGGLTLRGETDFGRLNHVQLSQDVAYDPALVLGSLAHGGINPAVSSLAPEPSSGFTEQRSWSSTSTASAMRRWNPRQTTTSGYSFSQRGYLDEFGFDSVTHAADLRHSWTFRRTLSAEGSYRFSDARIDSSRGEAPLTDQDMQLGLSYSRRLSPSRQLYLSGGIGATFVETLHALDRTQLQYWTPSGRAEARIDVGRSWAIGADYGRAQRVLQGVTVRSFATDSATLQIDGMPSRKTEISISTGYSNGRSGGNQGPGRFETYAGSAQFRYALSRVCAAMVNYDYFYYRLRDIQDLASGFPKEYDRNAVRVGFTFWLPLYGSVSGRAAGRN
jgi:opacity protein-like surface antigen